MDEEIMMIMFLSNWKFYKESDYEKIKK
jgi:hypothetical protein